jgi:UDP-N-acetylglucosamine 2-epimerase (non-hydrolysing)
MVLVQGDTASVFFGGLAAFFHRLTLGHVEAGLRSGHDGLPYPDPYPEEIFRRLTDVLTTLHFAPTPWARRNLMREGVPDARIHVTGNTVVDALLATSRLRTEPGNRDLKEALASGRRLVLLTAHRRESFGAPLREAFAAVRKLADLEETVEVLYPVHPNPHVREAASQVLQGHSRIRLTEPLDYLDLVLALRTSDLVLTDSGGVQEEAPTFGTPVLVLRNATERPEGVEAGVAKLVGTDGAMILAEARKALAERPSRRAGSRTDEEAPGEGSPLPNPYGDGKAGERIADIVAAHLSGRPRETTDWGGA